MKISKKRRIGNKHTRRDFVENEEKISGTVKRKVREKQEMNEKQKKDAQAYVKPVGNSEKSSQ